MKQIGTEGTWNSLLPEAYSTERKSVIEKAYGYDQIVFLQNSC